MIGRDTKSERQRESERQTDRVTEGAIDRGRVRGVIESKSDR